MDCVRLSCVLAAGVLPGMTTAAADVVKTNERFVVTWNARNADR